MATLEKIRSKSVLLFIVIIGALLAFILGDFITNGRTLFGGGNTVAQIGDHKVDAQLFQQRVASESQRRQDQGQKVDIESLQAEMLEYMLMEQMLKEEFDKLGIELSGEALRQILSQNPQVSQVLAAIQNPAQYNLPVEMVEQLKQQIVALEKEQEIEASNSIYAQLFNGLYVANELDAKDVYDAINKKYDVSFVSKEFVTEPDDKYQVSDAEIHAEWEKMKPMYKLDRETREIKYITVSIQPSMEDKAAADKIVEDAVAKLSASEGVEAIAEDVNFKVKTQVYTPSKIKLYPQLKSFADSAKVGSVVELPKMGNTCRIAKILSSKVEMDSVNVAMVQVSDSAAFDSVYTALKNGAKYKDFANANDPSAKTQVSDSIWIEMTHPNIAIMLGTDSIVNKIKNSTAGALVPFQGVLSGQPVNVIYVVNKTTPAVKIMEIAEITYEVEPSAATITKLEGDLDKFLAENTTIEAIAENAGKSGYSLMPSSVTDKHPFIANLPGTRNVVKWIMNADKGAVSAPYKVADDSRLLVVMVDQIHDNGYLTTNSEAVKKVIADKLRNEKKAKKIVDDLNANKCTNLEAYASVIGDSIATTSVSFDNTTINSLGAGEITFVGAVTAAQKGQLIAPFKANKSVVVVRVDEVRAQDGRPYDFKEYSQHYNQKYVMPLSASLYNILKGDREEEWNMLDLFEREIEE